MISTPGGTSGGGEGSIGCIESFEYECGRDATS